jgi:hypothetical protein
MDPTNFYQLYFPKTFNFSLFESAEEIETIAKQIWQSNHINSLQPMPFK